jgi:hypothetical protein
MCATDLRCIAMHDSCIEYAESLTPAYSMYFQPKTFHAVNRCIPGPAIDILSRIGRLRQLLDQPVPTFLYAFPSDPAAAHDFPSVLVRNFSQAHVLCNRLVGHAVWQVHFVGKKEDGSTAALEHWMCQHLLELLPAYCPAYNHDSPSVLVPLCIARSPIHSLGNMNYGDTCSYMSRTLSS